MYKTLEGIISRLEQMLGLFRQQAILNDKLSEEITLLKKRVYKLEKR